jgi:exonuclease SbcD
VKILHTSDWHIGRTLRGRSRADEHVAVLRSVAEVAAAEHVDVVLVVGDVFDTAAPTAESERIAYAALLDLAETGATVIVLSGNHDNDRRLEAVAPLLGLGRIVTRASFLPAGEGGVVTGETVAGEPWRVATVPFLSQRWVVRAADLLGGDADEHRGTYAARVAALVRALTSGFSADAVNIVAAHLFVDGGLLGGGERAAHTIFDYAVSPAAFPASLHYVALGHLHRAQAIGGPCPIRYCGSPLQLDFGETADTKSVTVVTAAVGTPAQIECIELEGGRRLRTVRGTLASLASGLASTAVGDEWLKVVVEEAPRAGLVDEVRELFPDAVDVVVASPTADARAADRPERSGRSPHDLFAAYLAERGVEDPPLVSLFDLLLEDAMP